MLNVKEINRIDINGGDILGRMEASIEIRAPPKKVWEMLAVDRFPEWAEGIKKNLKSIDYTSEIRTQADKYKVGATARQTDNKGKTYDYEIMESLENEKLVFQTTLMDSVVTFLLEPVDVGTKIIYRVDYKVPGGIFGKALAKLFFQRMGEKEFQRSLENLKGILEK